jgi:hypothetical protein
MKTRHLAAALALLLLASCLAHQPAVPLADVPGFWKGIWHGVVAPIALVLGIFSDVRVYAFPNTGGWYDLGFLLGLTVWGGGGCAARRRR